MPHAPADDIKLYFEDNGPRDGAPIVFVHEFAGDVRSWDTQVGYFSRRYRCIAFNARGYPPSDVPADPADYTQDRQADDIAAVLDHLDIPDAVVVGLSMGAFATLHFGLRHPDRARALVLGGIGSGAPKGAERTQFQAEARAVADTLAQKGWAAMVDGVATGPTRIQLRDKDPQGWARFREQLLAHSAEGSANTLRGYQAERPSLYDLEEELRALAVPTLIAVGDEDDPCLAPSVWLKSVMPWAGLWVVPRTGHCVNLEEPAAFNARVQDFVVTVAEGRWQPRRPTAGAGAFGEIEPE